jgi:2-keto-4-pentenoate hydratase
MEKSKAEGKSWVEAARMLIAQRRSLQPIVALPESLRPRNEAEGYALQDVMKRQLIDAGLGPQVGHKIGCTTDVMRKFLNIPTPCAGNIFANGVLRKSGRVSRKRFVKIGIECEIAVILGSDLIPDGTPFTRERVAAAVSAVMPAIEIVDDRYRDFAALGAPTLTADDFFHSGSVLGESITDWQQLDLASLSGATFIDGVQVGRGTGASVMGHPLNALTWLANSRAANGLAPLRRGEFVSLGSLVETKWLAAGMRTHIEIEQLGTVELFVDE